MNITDLNISSDLDRSALSAVRGGGVVARQYLGSSTQYSSWQYHGEAALAFLGNVYIHGRGWTKKFRTVRTYSRKQIFRAFYNVYVA